MTAPDIPGVPVNFHMLSAFYGQLNGSLPVWAAKNRTFRFSLKMRPDKIAIAVFREYLQQIDVPEFLRKTNSGMIALSNCAYFITCAKRYVAGNTDKLSISRERVKRFFRRGNIRLPLRQARLQKRLDNKTDSLRKLQRNRAEELPRRIRKRDHGAVALIANAFLVTNQQNPKSALTSYPRSSELRC